jgi:hypothetical protein
MKNYKKLTLTQNLLEDFRGLIRSIKSGRDAGFQIPFVVFDRYLEEHPEHITFYIDLFNLSQDEIEKEILGTIIMMVCRYAAAEEFLKKIKLNPWPDEYFHDDIEYVISSKEIIRLMSLPKDQRLSYNPDDEPVVREILDELQKNLEDREKQEAEKSALGNKNKK